MFAIALQCRRLRAVEPEDQQFALRWWADVQFLIIVLCRLRLAANLARKAQGVSIVADIKKFDDLLQHLTTMRNVSEHIDEYAVDSRRRRIKTFRRHALQAGTWDGTTFSWLGGELNVTSALLSRMRSFSPSVLPGKRRLQGIQVKTLTMRGTIYELTMARDVRRRKCQKGMNISVFSRYRRRRVRALALRMCESRAKKWNTRFG